jgi:hypothetical protein
MIVDRLTDRLVGKYACGPTMANGEPEFGYRQFETAPVQHEAAAHILGLETSLHAAEQSLVALKADNERLREALAKLKIVVSGGLCYFTAEAKHAQLNDAAKQIDAALGETHE